MMANNMNSREKVMGYTKLLNLSRHLIYLQLAVAPSLGLIMETKLEFFQYLLAKKSGL